MNTSPLLIEENSLSGAWCKVMDYTVNNTSGEITPLVLSLTDFSESSQIKEILNSDLLRNKQTEIDTVSETIFPDSLYRLCKRNRKHLYTEYKNNLPRIHALDTRNRRGTYFERLIDFDGKNQLEIIITSMIEDSSVRRSKLQAAIFDPRKDHLNSRYQGFPCLQHVTFCVTSGHGLILNSFYAIQLLYKKAYGNWLGLINLGKFVANETGLEFERFNCYVGVEQLGITKTEARKLLIAMNKN